MCGPLDESILKRARESGAGSEIITCATTRDDRIGRWMIGPFARPGIYEAERSLSSRKVSDETTRSFALAAGRTFNHAKRANWPKPGALLISGAL